MWQYWADLPLWELLFNEHEIQTVIELGTAQGGFSLFLKMQCLVRGMDFHTIDRKAYPLPEILQADFVQGDFWQSDDLSDWLQFGQRPLLLSVDGGCKRREFAAFVPWLEPGDYVAVHDYGTEFTARDAMPVRQMLEPILEAECKGPPQPCITRFWRVV